MGMFDRVKCERVMPDGLDGRGVEFQTKDLECSMEHFTITDAGRLIHHKVRYEVVPEDERPYAHEGGLMAMIGSIRSIPVCDEDLEYHGYLELCAREDGVFHDYRLKFTDGKLVEIEAVNGGAG